MSTEFSVTATAAAYEVREAKGQCSTPTSNDRKLLLLSLLAATALLLLLLVVVVGVVTVHTRFSLLWCLVV